MRGCTKLLPAVTCRHDCRMLRADHNCSHTVQMLSMVNFQLAGHGDAALACMYMCTTATAVNSR